MPTHPKPRFVAAALFLLAAVAVVPRLAAEELGENALRQLAALYAEKEARTPAEQKISTAVLYAHRQSKGEPMVSGLPPLPRVTARANVQNGMVVVDVRAEVTDELLGFVANLGGSVISSHSRYNAFRASVPIRRIDELAARDEVRFISPEEQFLTNTGSQTSQGDTAHAAASTRTSLSINGTGIKVGVLSNGVDSLAARQATGDLPPVVTIVPGQAGTGDEGTAMLEIVHDLAPGAQLFYATANGGQATFAANIQTLRNTYGCDVIIDDVTYFAEGAFQDGAPAQAVNAVTAAGALYFSSAANSGSKDKGTSGTWEGDFKDSLTTLPGVGAHPIHTFNGLTGGSAANSNALTLGTNSAISLKWSDPLGGSGNDYDLLIFDAGLTSIVDFSADFQTGTQDPLEIVGPTPSGERVVVVKFSGQARALRVDTNRGRLTINTAGSTYGHNGGASTITVAATDVTTVAPGAPFTAPRPVESYSSDGPRKIFYNPNGTAITPGNVLFGTNGGRTLLKPDVTAADCNVVTTPGFSPFCGTSAAAPHAGAIAALLKSLPTHPSGVQVQTAMYVSAIDIEAAGRDRDAGVGIVMANLAASALNNIPATNFFTVAPCRLVDTRQPAGPFGGPALTCGDERLFIVAGACGVPSGAKAVSVNATVTTTSGAGNLRLYASGAPAPDVSALNWSTGQTRGNNAIVPLSASGHLATKCAPSGTTDFILDVNGYFQ